MKNILIILATASLGLTGPISLARDVFQNTVGVSATVSNGVFGTNAPGTILNTIQRTQVSTYSLTDTIMSLLYANIKSQNSRRMRMNDFF